MEQATVENLGDIGRAEEWPAEKQPGALKTLYRHRELVFSLIFRDIRSRYKQSLLGIAWAVLQPLAMTIIYTIVFSHIAKIDTGGIPYPIFSYVAMLFWNYFGQGIISGTECLTSNFNLITKIYFPREVFPIAAVLGKTVDLALGMIVLVPLFIYYDIHLTWTVLMVIPALLIETCLLLGVTFMFSSINLFYRDVRHIMPLLTQAWMYLTPIIYPLSLVPKRFLSLYMMNPMSVLMDTYRRAVLTGQMPDWGYLGLSAAFSVVILILGYRTFKKLEPAFAETI